MDTVIKIGGSLAEEPDALKRLCLELWNLRQRHRFVIVPGGGRFADAVRDLDARLHLDAVISHRLAILAMDQYGIVLSSLIPNSKTCESLIEAERVSKMGNVPVFLPSKLLFHEDLEASWDVTSDSIAAYVAGKLHASKVVFVTDVDGIFTDNPKTNLDAALMSEISVEDLLTRQVRTSVDKFLPKLLFKNPVKCYVVNGFYPERVRAVLSDQRTICTKITIAKKT